MNERAQLVPIPTKTDFVSYRMAISQTGLCPVSSTRLLPPLITDAELRADLSVTKQRG